MAHFYGNTQQHRFMLETRVTIWQQEARTSATCALSYRDKASKLYWQEEAAMDAENARNALFALIDHTLKGE